MVSLGLTSDANLLESSSRSWRLISDGLCQMARSSSGRLRGVLGVEVRGTASCGPSSFRRQWRT